MTANPNFNFSSHSQAAKGGVSTASRKMADWYDHPQYFDMVFRDETAAEIAFLEDAFERYATRPVRKLLEPGCGSGRLVADLAALDYEVTGLDLSEPMLKYLARRLKRRQLSANLKLGDMTQMDFHEGFDAAFCTFNTFRHLLNDEDALSHLNSVSDNLLSGGIYVLGFHIIPLDADTECTERWKASHAGTDVSVTLQVINFQRNKRQETLRVLIKATKRSGSVERIKSEFPLRLYTQSQVKKLFARVADSFELVGIHDFDYNISEQREFDEDLTDAVFVLRKR